MQNKKPKIAIVLLNLGGPDSLKSIKNFLFNLFYDPAIITLNNPWRWIIAKIISTLRTSTAKDIYASIGNKSPILEETNKQKDALSEELKKNIEVDFKIFVCMRHWEPKSSEVVKNIERYYPDEIILLPLYPQFSTTTTGSAIKDFKESYRRHAELVSASQEIQVRPHEIPKQVRDDGKTVIKTICCYYDHADFIKAHAELIKEAINKIENKRNSIILFSAHGLPVKIIKKGDPYQWQVEKTVENIMSNMSDIDLNYKITYQSRVGPMEWLKPDTKDEIEIAAKKQKSLIIVPIAFVSEHVETLVELDIEYAKIAREYQVQYIRVPALGVNEDFIRGLSKIIINCVNEEGRDAELVSSSRETLKQVQGDGSRLTCPPGFTACPCKK